MHHESATDSSQPRPQLSLLDTTSIIVGIIIGSGLYVMPPPVAHNVSSGGEFLAVWAAGGVFALLGALCYAELATTYPAAGGEFIYLSEAFGRGAGFLFAWVQLWVVRPASIGFMAFVFAQYAAQLAGTGAASVPLYAGAAVVGLAAVNILGVAQGKWTQNILSAAKVLGLFIVMAAGFLAAPATEAEPPSAAPPGAFALAMVLVMFTFGGWNDMVSVAAEVRPPPRNILWALVLGTGSVAAIYLLVNGAYLHALGLGGIRRSQAVAADTVAGLLGAWGGVAVSGLICISALGSMTGMTCTGSRVYYAMGRRHRGFAFLGRWHPRLGTPVASLATEAAITLAMIGVLVGVRRSDQNVFERLAIFTAPLMWLILGLTALGLVILRIRAPAQVRPFRVPGYPLSPLIFGAGCGYMAYSSVAYALANRAWEGFWAVGVVAVGAALAVRDRAAPPSAQVAQ